MLTCVMRGWRAGLASFGGLALLAGSFFWMGRATAPSGLAPEPAAELRVPKAPQAATKGPGDEFERARNRELAAQVAWLQAQLALLGETPDFEPAPERTAEDMTGQESGDEADVAGQPWFDSEELLDRGLPESEVARLQATFNEAQMQRIELQNQAEREGWIDKPRYWQELVGLQLGIRDEIGDENYDLMLYATGRKNRVVIRDLLENSPGEAYGFSPGDVVLSYAGERVFHGRELRSATAQGERGEWINVDLLRDGEVVRIRAQRGPIGARLRPARILPESLW